MTRLYIANLANRVDRANHARQAFANRPEFDMKLVAAKKHAIGSYGLWLTLKELVAEEQRKNSAYFVFCEDDHQFTEQYDPVLLKELIHQSLSLGADLLLGGVSWVGKAIPVRDHLFWVAHFTGLQFTVIFRKFYDPILRSSFRIGTPADHHLSSLTTEKFTVFPYISTQKEFGYSDITEQNAQKGYVDSLFSDSAERFGLLQKVNRYFKHPRPLDETGNIGSAIPCFSLTNGASPAQLPESTIQAAKRRGFDIQSLGDARKKRSYSALLKAALRHARANDFPCIALITSPFAFAAQEQYTISLQHHIAYSLQVHADVLLCNIDACKNVLPVARQCCWVDSFSNTSLVIVFKKMYDRIIEWQDVSETDFAERLSIHCSNKLVMYPFLVHFSKDDEKRVAQFTTEEGLENYLRLCEQYGCL
jgi:hypothetical protein